MTTIDEKEILEIEKLKLEVKYFLEHKPKIYKLDIYKAMLLTVAVTIAVVTAYFKFQIGV